jgi:hypothetical protein
VKLAGPRTPITREVARESTRTVVVALPEASLRADHASAALS